MEHKNSWEPHDDLMTIIRIWCSYTNPSIHLHPIHDMTQSNVLYGRANYFHLKWRETSSNRNFWLQFTLTQFFSKPSKYVTLAQPVIVRKFLTKKMCHIYITLLSSLKNENLAVNCRILLGHVILCTIIPIKHYICNISSSSSSSLSSINSIIIIIIVLNKESYFLYILANPSLLPRIM